MRIAQIAPLCESVPPRLYGGTERVVSYLTEELVKLGHHVTLFASGDSVTSAELVSCAPRALRLDPTPRDPILWQMMMLDAVRARRDEFDILHFHVDYLHFSLFKDESTRVLTTLHGRQDLPDHRELYRRYAKMPLVSISDAQRAPVPGANFIATVHHGIPLDLHRPSYDGPKEYVAFLGRISPEKRPDRAIEIARRAGIPLKIAAKVDRVDEPYFREVIEPMLKGPGVEFVGEINERQKSEFLGNAAALLFPIDWPEPFGLVMIEAMACGTPVLAFRCGSVPEIISDKVTGRIVASVDDAVKAIPEVLALDRRAVRRRFEERFSSTRMAKDYARLYHAMLRNAEHRSLDHRAFDFNDGHVHAPHHAMMSANTGTAAGALSASGPLARGRAPFKTAAAAVARSRSGAGPFTAEGATGAPAARRIEDRQRRGSASSLPDSSNSRGPSV